MALILVSLFCLVVYYDDLTFWSKILYCFWDFFLLHSAYVWWDEEVVKF